MNKQQKIKKQSRFLLVSILIFMLAIGMSHADLLGDECDPDDDNDGILDVNDNCPFIL